jgi:hypothetical protein
MSPARGSFSTFVASNCDSEVGVAEAGVSVLQGSERQGGSERTGLLGAAVARLLRIPRSETDFRTRGFPDTPARPALEAAGGAFLDGYNLAVAAADVQTVIEALEGLAPRLRGFFAEGAAMGAALRSLLPAGAPLLAPLLRELTPRYVHLVHVGVGWAVARVPWAERRLTRFLDPGLAPLAIDGRGFHNGYFRRHPAGDSRAGARTAAAPVYDQGYGRSLWFSQGADPARLKPVIAALAPSRRGDFWAGIGLACVYAGGVEDDEVDRLAEAAGPDLEWLRQGAAFAIGAHQRSGHMPDDAARRAMRLTGRQAQALTEIVDLAFAEAERSGLAQPARYRLWRERVARSLATESGAQWH